MKAPLKIAALKRQVKTLQKENKRLREVEHLAWHLLDDSETRPAGLLIENDQYASKSNDIIVVGGKQFDALSKLLPEDHPGNE